jgi:Mg2+ and Co2+ transporter CorA
MLTLLQDLMYKSVGIRDSRHGLQLNTSLWRLSWITFIFLPLTFTVGFFGMHVDAFSTDVSIKWYFIVAVSLMAVVLLGWYVVKSFLLRRRQTPYSRGIYDVSISRARFFLKCTPV